MWICECLEISNIMISIVCSSMNSRWCRRSLKFLSSLSIVWIWQTCCTLTSWKGTRKSRVISSWPFTWNGVGFCQRIWAFWSLNHFRGLLVFYHWNVIYKILYLRRLQQVEKFLFLNHVLILKNAILPIWFSGFAIEVRPFDSGW